MSASNKNAVRGLALLLAAAFAAGGALADKDGKHKGKHKHGKNKYDDDRIAYYDGGYRGCPPGLAKKHNGCLPPGQAKKLRVGERIPRDVVYYPVPQPVLVRLPAAAPGYQYVRVGNDVVLMQPRTGLVINIFANLG